MTPTKLLAIHALSSALVVACGASTSDEPAAGQDAAAGAGGSAGAAGSGGASTGGSPIDAGSCTPSCGPERACCDGKCANLDNDPTNCGGCNMRCEGATPFCSGTCQITPCEVDGAACDGGFCCGGACCSADQICCKTEGPLESAPVCYQPTADQPTCPMGCAPLCISDRSQKREIAPVDPLAILDTMSRLPISTWAYRNEPPGVRHMGPMAQDFKAAFGLGDTDRAYYSVDAHGVTIAAIQALHDLAQQQARRVELLEEENRRLERRVHSLEATARGR
jgi:hypothetical protein